MPWTEASIHETVEKQRAFFRTGQTLDVNWRITQLKKLRDMLKNNEQEIEKALREDLSRSTAEAYFCDIGDVILETNEMIHGLRRWARPETHFSGFTCFPSIITKVHKMPYGATLIISPFNFPFLLSLGVLAASIAGGNTAVIKASSKSAACTAVLQKLIAATYPDNFCTVVDGGHDIADLCLAERFDKIFYTGSPKVGVHVMEMAARHLTPVALELGGETGNWCVVRKDADLKDAARKIAFFKLCNSGQICININQVAVAEETAPQFIEELKAAFIKQIGEDAIRNPEYPRLITAGAYDKCAAEADQYRDRIVYGGSGDREALKYNPTILYPIGMDEPIVLHELFNPLLPVVPFRDADADKVMDMIAEREHPLALYLFTGDKKWAKRVMAAQQYGGGCINEVCLHLMVKGAPFNGTGHSGMGAYHGIWGFREFTHPSTVLIGSRHFNLPLREHPYEGKKNAWKMKMLKIFER
ncbi:MAG: aldehyde dehydrogenase family protein [Clostridia bacterium]|nr:aldehyde dehydrogenase family protein [Clostridia bacterium]